MITRNALCHGSDQGQIERLVLQIGPLRMVFEPDVDFLRYVRLGEVVLQEN